MKTIHHVATLDYCDEPILFEGHGRNGEHYLAAAVDDSEDGEILYVVVGVSLSELKRFRSGLIDLRKLMLKAGSDAWYTASFSSSAKGFELEPQDTPLATSEYLPSEGYTLDPATSSDTARNLFAELPSPMRVPLGRQICHSRCVVRTGVSPWFSPDKAFRYKLEIPYRSENGRDRTVAVILKNPSSADEHNADTTIRRVEEYVHRNFPQAATLIVLNLFAYRATYPKDVEKRLRLDGLDSIVGNSNDDAIAATIDASDDVILAWGARSGINKDEYFKRISQVSEILNPHRLKLWHVKALTKDGHPRHALQWAYDSPKTRILPNWRWFTEVGGSARVPR